MKKNELLIGMALLVCLFIYLFYRTERTVVNDMVMRLTSPEQFATIRAQVVKMLPLNDIVIYSLPEGLWIMCITLSSNMYYLRLFRLQIDCKYIPIILCLALEVMQLFHITNGRFDIMDILVTLVFWLPACTIFPYLQQKQNIFTSLNARAALCIASYSIVYLAHVYQ